MVSALTRSANKLNCSLIRFSISPRALRLYAVLCFQDRLLFIDGGETGFFISRKSYIDADGHSSTVRGNGALCISDHSARPFKRARPDLGLAVLEHDCVGVRVAPHCDVLVVSVVNKGESHGQPFSRDTVCFPPPPVALAIGGYGYDRFFHRGYSDVFGFLRI